MKRLKKRGGFTLTETLIAVALLAIVTAAGATVSGVVISVRNGMIQAADSEVLASTILEALADEVRFGQNFETNTKTVSDPAGTETEITVIKSFDSMTFGSEAEFSIDSNGKIIATAEVGVDAGGDPVTKPYKLLTDSAYSHLKVKAYSLEMVYDGGVVTISLTIQNSADKDLWSGSLTVAPLNKI